MGLMCSVQVMASSVLIVPAMVRGIKLFQMRGAAKLNDIQSKLSRDAESVAPV